MTAAKNMGMRHREVERERKHSITPGDARTSANPTCGASARLVNLYSNYVCDFVLFCLVAVVSICLLFLRYTVGPESGMGPDPVLHFYFYFYFWAAYNPSRCFSLTAVSVSVYIILFSFSFLVLVLGS